MNQQLLFAIKLFTLASGYLFTRSRTRTIKYRIREKSIPDVAVLFILENLKRLILHHTRLIRDAENQIEMLENDVRLLKAFLKDYSRRRYTNKVLEDFVGQIKSVVSGAENVIGDYEIQMKKNKEMNLFQKAFGGSTQLIAVAKEVQKIRANVNGIFGKSRTVFATRPVGVEMEKVQEEEKKMIWISLRSSGCLVQERRLQDESQFKNGTRIALLQSDICLMVIGHDATHMSQLDGMATSSAIQNLAMNYCHAWDEFCMCFFHMVT